MSHGAIMTRVLAAFAVVLIFLAVVANGSHNDSEVRCSKTCVAENCNSVGIRYGKYCGVGWTGCPGEKPCDDLDACCKIHDECVTDKGLTNIKCHEKFKRCIKRVQKSGKVGFSRVCPYETAVPTMVQDAITRKLLDQTIKNAAAVAKRQNEEVVGPKDQKRSRGGQAFLQTEFLFYQASTPIKSGEEFLDQLIHSWDLWTSNSCSNKCNN